MMLGGRKGDASAALRTLEEADAVMIATQQIVRGRRGAAAVRAADVGHSRISRKLYVCTVYGKPVYLSPVERDKWRPGQYGNVRR